MGVLTRSAVIGSDDSELSSLVEGARSGRRAALDQLIGRVYLRVRGWAARFADDEDAADDIAQEVLIALDRRVKRFDGRSKFSTWLFTVTRNVAISQRLRAERRAQLLDRRIAESDAPVESDPDTSHLAELALRYYEALPARQKLIFELCDIRGFTPAEVARDLKLEQSTVRVHLLKARRAIRAKLLEHHERLLKEYRS